MEQDGGHTVQGPNLRLDDLRYLLARCARLPGDCPVTVSAARIGPDGLTTAHESIRVSTPPAG